MYNSAALFSSISVFPSSDADTVFIPALNLKLSVAPSAPIIANYLLQPEAVRRLACSNQTLLFSRRGCEVHQKQPSNTQNIPSCQRIWVRVLASCQIQSGKGSGDRVLFSLTDPVNAVVILWAWAWASDTAISRQAFNTFKLPSCSHSFSLTKCHERCL